MGGRGAFSIYQGVRVETGGYIQIKQGRTCGGRITGAHSVYTRGEGRDRGTFSIYQGGRVATGEHSVYTKVGG